MTIHRYALDDHADGRYWIIAGLVELQGGHASLPTGICPAGLTEITSWTQRGRLHISTRGQDIKRSRQMVTLSILALSMLMCGSAVVGALALAAYVWRHTP
jgi:hypothetical protein